MSDSLYVVRRSFKAQGILYMVGEIISDPSAIKLFRSRLNTRDVLELSKDSRDLASWVSYLEARVPELDLRILDLLSTQIAEKASLEFATQSVEDFKVPEIPVNTEIPLQVKEPEVPVTPTVPVTPVQVVKSATTAKTTVVKSTVKNS